jgi:hypothetical protein
MTERPPPLCAHCQYRPCHVNPTNGTTTKYCSDHCREAADTIRQRDTRRILANRLRATLGMPERQSCDLTAPELATILARITAVIPGLRPPGRPGRPATSRHGTRARYQLERRSGAVCDECAEAETTYQSARTPSAL